jgi:hypothetical protein
MFTTNYTQNSPYYTTDYSLMTTIKSNGRGRPDLPPRPRLSTPQLWPASLLPRTPLPLPILASPTHTHLHPQQHAPAPSASLLWVRCGSRILLQWWRVPPALFSREAKACVAVASSPALFAWSLPSVYRLPHTSYCCVSTWVPHRRA